MIGLGFGTTIWREKSCKSKPFNVWDLSKSAIRDRIELDCLTPGWCSENQAISCLHWQILKSREIKQCDFIACYCAQVYLEKYKYYIMHKLCLFNEIPGAGEKSQKLRVCCSCRGTGSSRDTAVYNFHSMESFDLCAHFAHMW